MGLINNDVYVASNGVEKVGTYISFATETLYLRQNSVVSGDQTYSVNANYRIYWDQECREMGKSFIDLKSVSANLTAAQLNGNLYEALYDALKLIYPNTGNTRVAAPSQVTPAPSQVTPAEPSQVTAPAPAEPSQVTAPAPAEPVAPSQVAAPSENVVVNP